MSPFVLIGGLILYSAFSAGVVRFLRGRLRELLFCVSNVLGFYVFFFFGHRSDLSRFLLYLTIVLVQFITLRLWGRSGGHKPWIAFSTPLLFLIWFHYLPPSTYSDLGHLVHLKLIGVPYLIGLSYLAFRCSRLVLEVRNRTAEMPGILEYFNFALFLPTMCVGPINTYSNYRLGFGSTDLGLPFGRSSFRILVGFVKYKFLGSLCNQLTYSGLLLDDHPHPWVDLPVAVFFYYLFLYCNFSGFCDMAIGGAGLIGIPVPENFNNPFAARNIRDFWNRWHITLSQYMRDVVFAPLSKIFVRKFGVAHADDAIAVTILIVFLLIGVWHGAGLNFVAFGFVHAIGVIANHYYTIFLKRRLGRDGFKRYNANQLIHGAAVVFTFCYCAASLFLFANSPEDMKEIVYQLR